MYTLAQMLARVIARVLPIYTNGIEMEKLAVVVNRVNDAM